MRMRRLARISSMSPVDGVSAAAIASSGGAASSSTAGAAATGAAAGDAAGSGDLLPFSPQPERSAAASKRHRGPRFFATGGLDNDQIRPAMQKWQVLSLDRDARPGDVPVVRVA